MDDLDIDSLTLNAIMRAWPRTIRVFIDWHLHCVGCPIADFHGVADSADQHGRDRTALRAAILLAIEHEPTSPVPSGNGPPSASGGVEL